jgi:phage recombination protein Bet
MSKETGVITSVKYEAAGSQIELTLMDVKNYLVSGNANKVTNQEVGIFLKTCEGQKLNPFLREAYLVKYGEQPAQMIVGKDAFTKRAESNSNYKGVKSGVIVVNLNKQIENREGTFIYTEGGEKLVGGWARVHFKDDKEEVFNTVSLSEYNTGKSLWASKPATMIRKVALVQALRDAFPNALGQLYIAEEVGVDEDLPTDPINPKDDKKPEEAPKMAGKALKNQIMQLAHEKELMTGEGKEANISKLETLANENGMSLRALTEDQANQLIKILMEYQVIQEVPEENIQPVEESVEAEIVEDEATPSDEDNPF